LLYVGANLVDLLLRANLIEESSVGALSLIV